MRHLSWEEDSEEGLSLNDCRVRNYEEFAHLNDRVPRKIKKKRKHKGRPKIKQKRPT